MFFEDKYPYSAGAAFDRMLEQQEHGIELTLTQMDRDSANRRLRDYEKFYVIVTEIVGREPTVQAAVGKWYSSYAKEDEFPNTRDLVRRLLAIGDSGAKKP